MFYQLLYCNLPTVYVHSVVGMA